MTRTKRGVTVLLLVAYIIAAAAVLLYPKPVEAPYDAGLFRLLHHLHAHGVLAFVGYDFIETSANVVMFVPLGVLLTMIFPLRLAWLSVLIGFASSSAAELTQLLFLPDRFASVDDVIANTSGAIIGTIITVIIRTSMNARRGRRGHTR